MKFDAIPTKPGSVLAYSRSMDYTSPTSRPRRAILLERGGWLAAGPSSLISRPRRDPKGKALLVLVQGFTHHTAKPATVEEAKAYTAESASRWLATRDDAQQPPLGWTVTVVLCRTIVDTWEGWVPRLEALDAEARTRREALEASARIAGRQADLIRERLEAAGFDLAAYEQQSGHVRMSSQRFLAMLDALGAPQV